MCAPPRLDHVKVPRRVVAIEMGHVVNDPMTQRDLADPMTQLDFNDPTRPNDPVDPVDPSQV